MEGREKSSSEKEQCPHTLLPPHESEGRLNMCSQKSDRYMSIWTGISAISPLEIFRGAESPPLRAGIFALGVWNKSSAQNFRLSSVHLQRLCMT